MEIDTIDVLRLIQRLREQLKELIGKNSEIENTLGNIEEILLPSYCPSCNACGESDCCPPTRCMYVEHYEKEWQNLNSTLEAYYRLYGELPHDFDK